MHAVTQPQPLTPPSFSPHLLHAKWVWSTNEFLWPAINHVNEPRPAKDKKICSQSKTGSLELDFSISSLILIPFFPQTLPSSCCSYLLPSSPQSSSSSLVPRSSFHNLFFFFPVWFFTPFPSSYSFNISPSPASSCWAGTAWKQLINSPVVFPLLLLKNVLWDGINQHQVWHLPEDTQRTGAIRWSDRLCPLPLVQATRTQMDDVARWSVLCPADRALAPSGDRTST